jgi:hypothetical protein
MNFGLNQLESEDLIVYEEISIRDCRRISKK